MADTKISALTAVASVVAAQELAVNDAGASKKATADQVADFLGVKKKALGAAYTNSTTTGTEVTDLTFAGLPAGTYYVCWLLLFQSAATTTSCGSGSQTSSIMASKSRPTLRTTRE